MFSTESLASSGPTALPYEARDNRKAPPTASKQRVLVVDDEVVNVNVLKRYLSQEGYEVEGVGDGNDALAAVERQLPDLIILDLTMPGLDGLAVCERLRVDVRTRGIPILMVTARDGVTERIAGYRAGADDYLVKPYDLTELNVRMKSAMERRHWDLWLQPLTQLPGSPVIESDARHRLDRGEAFAFAYVDLDQFKSYNDVYGYAAGDQVIRMVGELLVETLRPYRSNGGFVGHVGGDDFVLMAAEDTLRTLLPRMVEAFDRRRLEYYRPEHRDSGRILCKNRRGEEEQFPLMTLSVAVVYTKGGSHAPYASLVGSASELKRYVKSLDHAGRSLVFWDRRGPIAAG